MIRVMGAGAFGTALAIALARNGPVMLWARDKDHLKEIAISRRNDRRLPGVNLPDRVTVSDGPMQGGKEHVSLIAVPTQKLREFCQASRASLENGTLIACCKGVELGTGRRPTEIIGEAVSGAKCAVLTGPSFAVDIARGLPAALTLACLDETAGEQLQKQLSTQTLRLYRSSDVTGAELGGALKNVMAIACGAVIGAGLGNSARAALMTRGFAEMCRAAVAMGARRETLAGLSGFGDLVLTCTSDQSRNYQFGLSLGRNEPFDPSVTVEGAATSQALSDLAEKRGLDLPVTRAVTALVRGELKVAEATDMLLSRPLKEE